MARTAVVAPPTYRPGGLHLGPTAATAACLHPSTLGLSQATLAAGSAVGRGAARPQDPGARRRRCRLLARGGTRLGPGSTRRGRGACSRRQVRSSTGALYLAPGGCRERMTATTAVDGTAARIANTRGSITENASVTAGSRMQQTLKTKDKENRPKSSPGWAKMLSARYCWRR